MSLVTLSQPKETYHNHNMSTSRVSCRILQVRGTWYLIYTSRDDIIIPGNSSYVINTI